MFYLTKSAGKCGINNGRWNYDERFATKAAVRKHYRAMGTTISKVLTVDEFKALEENGYKERIRKDAFGIRWEAICEQMGF